MRNKFEIVGQHVAISIRYKSTNLVSWIDLSDLDLVMKYPVTWYANPAKPPLRKTAGKFYVTAKLYSGDSKKLSTILLHRILLGSPNCDVNHKDNDGLNNRRDNLNALSHQENSRWGKIHRDWTEYDKNKALSVEYRSEREIAKTICEQFGMTRQAIYYIRVGKVQTSEAAAAYRIQIALAGIKTLAELTGA